MKNFIKKNWLLILVIIYILVPFDFLPVNPIDDALVLAVERIISSRISRLKKDQNSDKEEVK